ncbi:MAG: potassium channel family protein [Caldilineaceae bacterium]
MTTQARSESRAPQPAAPGNVLYLLILVVIVQFSYPMTAGNSPVWLLAYQALYLTLMIAGILVARESPHYMRVLIYLGLIWIVTGAIYAFNQEALWAQLGGYGAIAAFQIMVVIVLVTYMFRARIVTRNVLYAASTIYLLLGAIFVPIFGIIESLTFAWSGGAHAFADGVVAVGELFTWQNFVYYSYVNLTTLGYGDILPQTMWARSAATLEACIGVLYTAIIISRLVGLYASQEIAHDMEEFVEEQGRFERS